jgi:hypothetical protein
MNGEATSLLQCSYQRCFYLEQLSNQLHHPLRPRFVSNLGLLAKSLSTSYNRNRGSYRTMSSNFCLETTLRESISEKLPMFKIADMNNFLHAISKLRPWYMKYSKD